MASKYSRKNKYVSGKSTQALLDIDLKDLMGLSHEELKQVVSRLSSTANKRMDYFNKKGTPSPAYEKAMRTGGRFGTSVRETVRRDGADTTFIKAKNLNQLRKEYMRVKQFLDSKTSTYTGWTQVQRRTIDTLNAHGVDITPDQLDKFWRIYNKLSDIDPGVRSNELKYRTMREMADFMSDGRDVDVDYVVRKMQERMSGIYEESQRATGGADWIREFFDLVGMR